VAPLGRRREQEPPTSTWLLPVPTSRPRPRPWNYSS